MNIDDLKILLDLLDCIDSTPVSSKKSPFVIGKCYLIRVLTNYNLGRVKEIYDALRVLEVASWIVDTKRFHDFLRDGRADNIEVEPYVNDCIVGLGVIVDATICDKDLLRNQL